MTCTSKTIVTIVLTAFITALFVYILLTDQETSSSSADSVSFQQKQECQKMGKDYYQKDLADAEEKESTIYETFSIRTPTYGYSNKLNTCVYVNSSSSYMEQLDEHRAQKYVLDLMTNVPLKKSVYTRTESNNFTKTHSSGLTDEEFDAYVSKILEQ